jgi:hypothetical protein
MISSAEHGGQRDEERDKGDGQPGNNRSKEPEILHTQTVSAHRVSVYLHPEDARILRQGRVDDGADANTRIRALLAFYRTDCDLRTKVDELAKHASRRSRR